MNCLVHRLPENTRGRDFVVGDIHGAFDKVETAMAAVRFDASRDRLFSVGDLVNRGPESARCVAFLAHPAVHAVRGNHDDFVATTEPELAQVLAQHNFNGMRWIASTPPPLLASIQRALARLPIAMEVQTSRGLVGLVHGDIPAGMSWQEFTAAIERGEPDVIECALSGRARLKEGDESGVAGIGRVYVGHSIQWDGPRRLGNVYAVDTGAVFRDMEGFGQGSLSMVNLVCSTGVLCPRPDVPREPIEIYDHTATDPAAAFGGYMRSRC